MVQTWKTSKGEEVSCVNCGARYMRKIWRSPTRDHDNAICHACGYEMESWNSTSIPMYAPIEDGEKK